MVHAVEQKVHTTILAISNDAVHETNYVLVSHLYGRHEPIATIQLDDRCPPQANYKGMRVMITHNCNKGLGGWLNGQECTVHTTERNTVLVALPDKRVVALYPVTYAEEDGTTRMVLPLVPAYAFTVCKAQGQTLEALILWFNCDTVPQGTAHVAMTRVKRLQDLLFLTPIQNHHVRPIVMQ